MTNTSGAERTTAVRAMGGEHNAICAEQLRAIGRGERTIARMLGVEREAVARWFALQDELALRGDLDGAA
jgi:hypothetical protein